MEELLKNISPKPSNNAADRTGGALASWGGPAIVTVFGMILAGLLWGRTGELLLDFGRQLYVFWQMSLGKVLYRDLQYPFGLLAPTLFSYLMKFAGPSLQPVLVANLCVLSVVVLLLYAMLRKGTDELTSTIGVLIFLSQFGLSNEGNNTDMNFLTPYNHGVTIGFMFSLAGIWFADRFMKEQKKRWMIAAGIALGLNFLTKVEVFVAALAGIAAATLPLIRQPRELVNVWGILIASAVIPVLVAFGGEISSLPKGDALAATLGDWNYIFSSTISESPYYRHWTGIGDLYRNIALMTIAFAALAASIALFISISYALRKHGAQKWLGASIGLGLGGLIAIAGGWKGVVFDFCARAFPLEIATLVTLAGIRVFRTGTSIPAAARNRITFSFAAFALAMLLKMLFFSRTYHYGFVLGAAAGVSIWALLLYEIPKWLGASRGSDFFRWISVGAATGLVVLCLRTTESVLRPRQQRIELAMGGSLAVGPEDAAAGPATSFLAELTLTADTLAAFPNCSGLNYAVARSSSVPYVVLDPLEIKLSGEQRVLAALEERPPTYLLIIESNLTEYGSAGFGVDYALTIRSWIESHYEVIGVFPASGSEVPGVRKLYILRRQLEGSESKKNRT